MDRFCALLEFAGYSFRLYLVQREKPKMFKLLAVLLSVFLVTSCQTLEQENKLSPVSDGAELIEENKVLESWWSFFGDSALDRLVTSALGLNSLADSEKNFPKDDVNIRSLHDYYVDQRGGLVKNVVLDYVEYRYIQNQNILLGRYIDEQEFNLRGVDQTQVKIIEVELEVLNDRKAEFNMRLEKLTAKIASLTKLLPEYVSALLKDNQSIPSYDITPLLLEDTYSLFNNSAQIKADQSLLVHKIGRSISKKDLMAVFPSNSLNKFFSISDQVFAKNDFPWRVSTGNAVRQLNFSTLESVGNDKQETKIYRNAVFSYVMGIERILVGYSTLIEQEKLLSAAVDKAHDKDVYKAKLAVLRASYEKTKTLISLFDALNLY